MKIEAKHIHLIGICGTAMASLAGMLQLQGHTVTGSDAAAYPPMSDLLETLGIPVMEPYAEKNLEPRPDLPAVADQPIHVRTRRHAPRNLRSAIAAGLLRSPYLSQPPGADAGAVMAGG